MFKLARSRPIAAAYKAAKVKSPSRTLSSQAPIQAGELIKGPAGHFGAELGHTATSRPRYSRVPVGEASRFGEDSIAAYESAMLMVEVWHRCTERRSCSVGGRGGGYCQEYRYEGLGLAI